MPDKRPIAATKTKDALPIWIVTDKSAPLPEAVENWLDATQMTRAKAGVTLIPAKGDGSALMGAAINLGENGGDDPFALAALVKALPTKPVWYFANPQAFDMRLGFLGILLGAYSFDRYRKPGASLPMFVPPEGVEIDAVRAQAEATFLVRDLVNTPANDMGPDAIEAAARDLAKSSKANVRVIRGDELLAKNFPLIHAVGRASVSAPRLIDMKWGPRGAPKLTLVGKGVAYDTGGLDIKPSSAMRNMKKDMGGAANVLGLAKLIMQAKLNVRLRVLIPAVENSIAGNAFRSGDVYPSRKGLTVEIGNTDAEGRLVLADALSLADDEQPEMIVDMATLTGAARVALGPDLPPFYTDDEGFSALLSEAASLENDPLWRMPLWKPYAKGLASTVADCCNITTTGFAGSVTAALFLQQFVEKTPSWTHLDVFAWNPTGKPHAPIGGEAQGIRALFAALAQRFA